MRGEEKLAEQATFVKREGKECQCRINVGQEQTQALPHFMDGLAKAVSSVTNWDLRTSPRFVITTAAMNLTRLCSTLK